MNARQIQCMRRGSTRNVAYAIAGYLDTGELATGTPTVSASTLLTISSVAVSTGGLTVQGTTYQAGEVIQMSVAATTAVTPQSFLIDVTFATDSTPAQTVVADALTLKVTS